MAIPVAIVAEKIIKIETIIDKISKLLGLFKEVVKNSKTIELKAEVRQAIFL